MKSLTAQSKTTWCLRYNVCDWKIIVQHMEWVDLAFRKINYVRDYSCYARVPCILIFIDDVINRYEFKIFIMESLYNVFYNKSTFFIKKLSKDGSETTRPSLRKPRDWNRPFPKNQQTSQLDQSCSFLTSFLELCTAGVTAYHFRGSIATVQGCYGSLLAWLHRSATIGRISPAESPDLLQNPL